MFAPTAEHFVNDTASQAHGCFAANSQNTFLSLCRICGEIMALFLQLSGTKHTLAVAHDI